MLNSKDMPQVSLDPSAPRAMEHYKSSSSTESDIPKLPPRPNDKRLDRSVHPNQEMHAISQKTLAYSLQSKLDRDSVNSTTHVVPDAEICRPPSVNLPSLGQEGIEYDDVYVGNEIESEPSSTKFLSVRLENKIHAPKPTPPGSGAAIDSFMTTHTGSSKAYEKENSNDFFPRKESSQSGSDSHSLTRPDRCVSNLSNEHGIPHIGQYVPMYPNAGDVQAPPPSLVPYASTGVTTNENGAQIRNHFRKLSGRDKDIPSDSYGRYGHGITLPQDRFDKAYYKKHPELLKKETGCYGEARPEWAMSSEDLNKIVRDTASHGIGVGASIDNIGTPSEQIGLKASEEYVCRITSPRPQPGHQNTHLAHDKSEIDSPSVSGSPNRISERAASITVPEKTMKNSEDRESLGHENIIHVNDPARRYTSVRKAFEHTSPAEGSRSNSFKENTQDDHGYEAPILASDEVAKNPLGRELQPAVFPLNENSKASQEESIYLLKSRGESTQIEYKHGDLISATNSNDYNPTPLEDLEEYEPLFPEERRVVEKSKTFNPVEKLQCSEMNRRFPSQDIWEDTPNSLQYTATVSAPQLPEMKKEKEQYGFKKETLPQAFARRQEELAEQELKDPENVPPQDRLKKTIKVNLQPEPETFSEVANHRFPSRDIWEDTPDSLLLHTSVARPQMEKEPVNLAEEQYNSDTTETIKTYRSPRSLVNYEEETNAVGLQSVMKSSPQVKLGESQSPSSSENLSIAKRENATKTLQRPLSREALLTVPAKPKPQVPARPSKLSSRDSSGSSTSTHFTSNMVVTGKPKPPVPSRPSSGKIAAFQVDFMSDLNKRLQLGPQMSKKDSPKDEQSQGKLVTTPLVDPRKGRARGPVRRAPNKNLVPSSNTHTPDESNFLKISATSTIWSYDPETEYLRVLRDGVNENVDIRPIE